MTAEMRGNVFGWNMISICILLEHISQVIIKKYCPLTNSNPSSGARVLLELVRATEWCRSAIRPGGQDIGETAQNIHVTCHVIGCNTVGRLLSILNGD